MNTPYFSPEEWRERIRRCGSERAALCPLVYSPSEWRERGQRILEEYRARGWRMRKSERINFGLESTPEKAA